MSALLSIYDAIAALPVTVGGKTPTVYDLHQLPNSAEAAHCPCRLLDPLDQRLSEASFTWQTLGKGGVATVQWFITDRLLWRPAAQGQGLRDVAELLAAYLAAYAEQARQLRGSVPTKWMLTNLQMRATTFAWPAQSSSEFHGAICQLTIQEILS